MVKTALTWVLAGVGPISSSNNWLGDPKQDITILDLRFLAENKKRKREIILEDNLVSFHLCNFVILLLVRVTKPTRYTS